MYGIDPIQLASIEQEITRTNALIDACQRHNAPQEAIDTLTGRLIGYYNEKATLMGKGIQPDYERLNRKADMVEKLLEALDPDQNQTVSWWAD